MMRVSVSGTVFLSLLACVVVRCAGAGGSGASARITISGGRRGEFTEDDRVSGVTATWSWVLSLVPMAGADWQDDYSPTFEWSFSRDSESFALVISMPQSDAALNQGLYDKITHSLPELSRNIGDAFRLGAGCPAWIRVEFKSSFVDIRSASSGYFDCRPRPSVARLRGG
jgi:hypothetical protein